MASAPASVISAEAALPPTSTRLQAATAALAAARAAYRAAPYEECSTTGPLWAALAAASEAHLAAWCAHKAATRPLSALRGSLAGTSPLGLLFHASRHR